MSKMPRKRVAIIGAGGSGLCAIHHALLYDITPVCFELTDDIGGLWRYKDGTRTFNGIYCKYFDCYCLIIILYSTFCYEIHGYQYFERNGSLF